MKHKPEGKPEKAKSNRLHFCACIFIVTPTLAALAFLTLVPLFAIYASVADLGDALGFWVAVFVLMLMHINIVIDVIYALLAGKWFQLIRLLPALLELFRSVARF